MVVRKRLAITGRALAFLTTTAYQWTPIFGEGIVAKVVVNKLREATEHFRVSVVGYVLMPSHLHMLLGFPKIAGLSRFMQSFKILSSKAVKIDVPQDHLAPFMTTSGFRLWKPRFDDLIVTSDRQFRIKLEYIHNNPVRAGLVTRAEEWRFSSASDWLLGKTGPLPVDKRCEWLIRGGR
ncbi:MAG: transposase [Candidatus Zixiibacteriota bacterium]